jgi:DNA gyrase subunit B
MKEYSESDIQSLDSLDAIRLRPRLYLSECFEENNLNSIAVESLCHAIDEHIDGNCSNIEITANQLFLSLKYDAGISLESIDDISKAEAIMTKLFACKNEKKHLAVGDDFCKVGIMTVNAVSEKCELETVCSYKKGSFVFEKGKVVSKKIEDVEGKSDFTFLQFVFDKQIFGELVFDFESLDKKLNKMRLRFPDLKIKLFEN